jgi:hypothetical protein
MEALWTERFVSGAFLASDAASFPKPHQFFPTPIFQLPLFARSSYHAISLELLNFFIQHGSPVRDVYEHGWQVEEDKQDTCASKSRKQHHTLL